MGGLQTQHGTAVVGCKASKLGGGNTGGKRKGWIGWRLALQVSENKEKKKRTKGRRDRSSRE